MLYHARIHTLILIMYLNSWHIHSERWRRSGESEIQKDDYGYSWLNLLFFSADQLRQRFRSRGLTQSKVRLLHFLSCPFFRHSSSVLQWWGVGGEEITFKSGSSACQQWTLVWKAGESNFESPRDMNNENSIIPTSHNAWNASRRVLIKQYV